MMRDQMAVQSAETKVLIRDFNNQISALESKILDKDEELRKILIFD